VLLMGALVRRASCSSGRFRTPRSARWRKPGPGASRRWQAATSNRCLATSLRNAKPRIIGGYSDPQINPDRHWSGDCSESASRQSTEHVEPLLQQIPIRSGPLARRHEQWFL